MVTPELRTIIEITGLKKSYGDIHALDGVDLKLPSRKCFGLLGPNGAGKTTLMNVISTYIRPDEGDVVVDGWKTTEHEQLTRSKLGVVPQEISIYENLSARENILFFGGLYGRSPAVLKKRMNELLDVLGLNERADEPVKRYSGGMKRRLNIACSLAHEPEIILMDEPTVGIDPQSRNFIYEFIEGLKNQGRTIVYTSHYMEEVERLCDFVAIIDHGKIIAKGTTGELIEMVEGEDIVIIELGDVVPEIAGPISRDYTEYAPKFDDGCLRLTGKGIHKKVPEFLNRIIQADITPKSVHIKEPNLETVFLKLTGRELRD